MTKSGKHWGKRRNCSFWAISSFVPMFSKSCLLQRHQKASIWGKGLTLFHIQKICNRCLSKHLGKNRFENICLLQRYQKGYTMYVRKFEEMFHINVWVCSCLLQRCQKGYVCGNGLKRCFCEYVSCLLQICCVTERVYNPHQGRSWAKRNEKYNYVTFCPDSSNC